MTNTQSSPVPLWRKITAWILGIILSVSLIVIISLTAALWWLSPGRLTPMVNGFLSNYLEADVDAARVELTFWRSFPHIELRVDSLQVVSRRFDTLPQQMREALPADADSLLSVERFSGGIHVVKVIGGEIDLYDIEIANPKVNLVVAPDSTANFDIVPPSEPSTEPSTLPRLNINRFAILGSFPMRYRAIADSIDLALTLNASELACADAPQYTLQLAGGASPQLPGLNLPDIPFSLNGGIEWNQATPDIVALHRFNLSVLGQKMLFDAVLSLADPLTLNEFNISLPEVRPGKLLRLFAPDNDALARLDTDLRIDLKAKLLKPYCPAQSELPRLQVEAGMQASRVRFEQLDLSKFDSHLTAVIDDADLDRSTLHIQRLHIAGRAIDFRLSADVSTPISDPAVKGRFEGTMALDRLPRTLASKLPCSVSGTLTGEADFALRQSMLTPKKLHRIRLDGNLALHNLRVASNSQQGDAYIRYARLDLGTSSRRTVGDHIVDSLFTASLTIDTMAVNGPGLQASASGFTASVGSRNVASSADTTQINPFGGSITAHSFTLRADSSNTRIRLTDIHAGGALMRYNNNARAPRVEMKLTARRMILRNNSMRASLRDADATLSFHPRAKRAMSARMQSRYDSLAALYPTLSSDSLRVLARKELRRNRAEQTNPDGRENIDFNIDNSLSSWLRLWQLSGSLQAAKARFYTPHFPIRNRISHLDLDFSTDSVMIRNTLVESGHSDFLINGSIRDITRALTSKRHRPLSIDFDVLSDTIDINEFSATLLRGSAYTNAHHGHPSQLMELVDEEIELAEDYVDISVEEPPSQAVLVPSNIRADLRMRAANILYTDLHLRNFEGHVGIFDGAVDLDRFRADADIGSVELTALYSAPTRTDIQFAAGLKLHRLQLAQVLKLLPKIDSVMPMLAGISGIVDASVAVTTGLDSMMNVDLPSMDVAVRLTGDSLVLLDSETFRTVAKWMLFKNKKRNMIDHMDVEIMVHDGAVNLYPVIFDIDRYKLGVVGSNDLALNLDYHVAVLKSPLPFRFGVNIKGTPEKMKIRLGRARLDEKKVASHKPFADTVRVNLLTEMHRIFARGVRASGMHGLRSTMAPGSPASAPVTDGSQPPSAESTLEFIRRGLVNLDTTRRTIDPEKQKRLKKAGSVSRRLAH